MNPLTVIVGAIAVYFLFKSQTVTPSTTALGGSTANLTPAQKAALAQAQAANAQQTGLLKSLNTMLQGLGKQLSGSSTPPKPSDKPSPSGGAPLGSGNKSTQPPQQMADFEQKIIASGLTADEASIFTDALYSGQTIAEASQAAGISVQDGIAAATGVDVGPAPVPTTDQLPDQIDTPDVSTWNVGQQGDSIGGQDIIGTAQSDPNITAGVSDTWSDPNASDYSQTDTGYGYADVGGGSYGGIGPQPDPTIDNSYDFSSSDFSLGDFGGDYGGYGGDWTGDY
jgi:hypothetical protein